MSVARRRHAAQRFTTVWIDRFERHERTLDRLGALTAGIIVGALIVTGMVIARLYQQGVI